MALVRRQVSEIVGSIPGLSVLPAFGLQDHDLKGFAFQNDETKIQYELNLRSLNDDADGDDPEASLQNAVDCIVGRSLWGMPGATLEALNDFNLIGRSSYAAKYQDTVHVILCRWLTPYVGNQKQVVIDSVSTLVADTMAFLRHFDIGPPQTLA